MLPLRHSRPAPTRSAFALRSSRGSAIVLVLIVVAMATFFAQFWSSHVTSSLKQIRDNDFQDMRSRNAQYIANSLDCAGTFENAAVERHGNRICREGTVLSEVVLNGGVVRTMNDWLDRWLVKVSCGRDDLEVWAAPLAAGSTTEIAPHPKLGSRPLDDDIYKISSSSNAWNKSLCPAFFSGTASQLPYQLITMHSDTMQRQSAILYGGNITNRLRFQWTRCDGTLGLITKWYEFPPPRPRSAGGSHEEDALYTAMPCYDPASPDNWHPVCREGRALKWGLGKIPGPPANQVAQPFAAWGITDNDRGDINFYGRYEQEQFCRHTCRNQGFATALFKGCDMSAAAANAVRVSDGIVYGSDAGQFSCLCVN